MSAPETTEVIYEVECRLDPSIAEAFDAWLPEHIRQVLACEGFTGAEIQAPTEAAPGQAVVRRTQYRLKDQAALERYFEQDAPRLRADAAGFGDKATFTRRVLSPRAVADRLPEEPFTCLNCSAPVPGRYCAACGQSREVHVLSMHEVVGDVTHSLLHLDSRVWNTLRTLVLKPGRLTNEFIVGRHQRYLPPFRLYLVISVLFFALSALLPDAQMLHVNAEGDTVIAYGVSPPPTAGTAGAAAATREQAALELREALEAVVTAAGTPEVVRHSAEFATDTVEGRGGQTGCNINVLPGLPRLNALLSEACRKAQADNGRRLGQLFLSAAPKLMFFFLPLAAGVTTLFYWRPRRLYAEHLVAFLHSHAFVFLALAVLSVVNAIMRLDLPLVGILGLVNLVLILYIPYYVFRAMRVVYGESRVRTAVKFAAISLLYFILLGITMMIGVIYSMLSL
jgi:hypothetical protein